MSQLSHHSCPTIQLAKGVGAELGSGLWSRVFDGPSCREGPAVIFLLWEIADVLACAEGGELRT